MSAIYKIRSDGSASFAHGSFDEKVANRNEIMEGWQSYELVYDIAFTNVRAVMWARIFFYNGRNMSFMCLPHLFLSLLGDIPSKSLEFLRKPRQ